MRTEVLRYLIAVDEQHSVSKAANKLYISKSALSESISQLERELNVAIFQRTKKGVVTTAAGQQILEQAKVILENVEKEHWRHTNDNKAAKHILHTHRHMKQAHEKKKVKHN